MYEEYEDDYKGKEREKKLKKRENLMKINGRGLKSVILPILGKKTDSKSTRVTKRKFKSNEFNYLESY